MIFSDRYRVQELTTNSSIRPILRGTGQDAERTICEEAHILVHVFHYVNHTYSDFIVHLFQA